MTHEPAVAADEKTAARSNAQPRRGDDPRPVDDGGRPLTSAPISRLSPLDVVRMQRAAGNAATASLLGHRPAPKRSAGVRATGSEAADSPGRVDVQRCGDHPCNGPCTSHRAEEDGGQSDAPVQRCGDHPCSGPCTPPGDGADEKAAQDAEPAIQRDLESSATRRREPAASAPAGAGTRVAQSAPARTPAPPRTEPVVAAEAAAPTAGTALAEASAGQSVESAKPAPSRAAAPEGQALTGTPQAECYREDAEEPAEEPENEPPEPETTDAEERVESDSPDAEDRDDCPIEAAVEAAVPAGPVAALGARVGAAPTAAEPAADAPEAVAGTAGVAADAVNNVAGGQEEARVPLEGAIDQVEGARGPAVEAYTSATTSLGTASAGLGALDVPVAFAEEAKAAPEAAERQAAAQGRVGSFLTDGSRQLGETIAFARDAVPGRIGGVAEPIKASIASSTEAQKAGIVATVAGASQQALARATATRVQISAAHAASIGTIEQAAAGSLAALAAAHRQTLAAVDQREARALQSINSLYAASRAAHERLGPALAAVAVARGEEYAQFYETCKIHRKDGFWAGYLTDRRAEAQRKAARETAKGYSKSLVEAASKQAREVTKGRSKDRCGVIAAARSARETADAQLAALTTGIQDARAQAVRQAAAGRAQLLAAVDSAHRAAIVTLRRQEQHQRQAAEDVGYLQQALIEQVAHAGTASVQASVAQGAAVVGNTLGQAHAAFAAGPAPTAEQLDAGLGTADSAVRGGIASLAGQAEAAVGGVETRLMGAGLAAQAALDALTHDNQVQTAAQRDGFVQIATDLAGNGTEAFTAQTAAFVSRTQQTTEQGTAGFREVSTGFDKACTTIAEQITTGLENSVIQLRESLWTSLTGIDSRTSGIPKQAREAASHEQPAWKSVLKWVLIIAIIIVVAVVAGPAVIGAVGAAAASLGAGAAAAGVIGTVVGGAIVGAATSATIQVVNNVAEGRTWHQGIGRAAIMGAIGGAFGAGAGALIGKYVTGAVFQVTANIAADSVLEVGTSLVTGDFSWEALGMAVVMSAATGGFGELGSVKGIQSRFSYRGARVVPGEGARAYAAGLRPHGPLGEGAPRPRSMETAPELGGEARTGAAAEPAQATKPPSATDVETGTPSAAMHPEQGSAAAPKETTTESGAEAPTGSVVEGPQAPAPAQPPTVSKARQTAEAGDRMAQRAAQAKVEAEQAVVDARTALEQAKAEQAALPPVTEPVPSPGSKKKLPQAELDRRQAQRQVERADRNLQRAEADAQTAEANLQKAQQEATTRRKVLEEAEKAAADRKAAAAARSKEEKASERARNAWEKKDRPQQARDLGARKYEHLHHAIELDVLNMPEFAGAFTAAELAHASNIRLVPREINPADEALLNVARNTPREQWPPEVAEAVTTTKTTSPDGSQQELPVLKNYDSKGRDAQLHLGKVRELWDLQYAAIKSDLAAEQAQGRCLPGTREHKAFVRGRLKAGRKYIDWVLGPFWGGAKKAQGLRGSTDWE